LINLVKPYQKVTLKFLSKELSLSIEEVEALLVDLILAEKLKAGIDQPNGHLILESKNISQTDKHESVLLNLVENLANLNQTLLDN
jgi:hypothetical protein